VLGGVVLRHVADKRRAPLVGLTDFGAEQVDTPLAA
jgi:hypothetical protein